MPHVFAAQALDAGMDVITTRAFLGPAERRGLIASAAEARQAAVPNGGEPDGDGV